MPIKLVKKIMHHSLRVGMLGTGVPANVTLRVTLFVYTEVQTLSLGRIVAQVPEAMSTTALPPELVKFE